MDTGLDPQVVGYPQGLSEFGQIVDGSYGSRGHLGLALCERPMKVQSDKPFTHRYTADGTIESICMTCFRTVCQCRTEEEATKKEANHVCAANSEPGPFLFL